MKNKILEAIQKGIQMGLEIQDDEMDQPTFQGSQITSRSYDDVCIEKIIRMIEDDPNYVKHIGKNDMQRIVDYCQIHSIKVNASNETIGHLVVAAIECFGDECDLNWIDVKNVTDMSFLFSNETSRNFDGDISQWDVSNVVNMYSMFLSSIFNGDISEWDVSNVNNMNYMFYGSAFNSDISKWDVSNVANMQHMFEDSLFNMDISSWNVNNVIDRTQIFKGCKIRKSYKPVFTANSFLRGAAVYGGYRY